MAAGEAETLDPRGSDAGGSRLRQAVAASQTGLASLLRAINAPVLTRFCKYVVLIGCVILTLIVVFDAY